MLMLIPTVTRNGLLGSMRRVLFQFKMAPQIRMMAMGTVLTLLDPLWELAVQKVFIQERLQVLGLLISKFSPTEGVQIHKPALLASNG